MPDRPNVLFLLSDQHNHRCTGFHTGANPEPVETPTLDALANSGATFERAYCPMPLCSPSRLCLLTGRDVVNAGAWTNGSVLRPDIDTFASTLSESGYETALVGKMHLGGDRQFAGFDRRPYGDLLGLNGHQYEPVSPERRVRAGYSRDDSGLTEYPESQLQEANVIRESMAFLREQEHRSPDRPWLLCASFSRPHPPYTVPERHFARYWPDAVTEPHVQGEDATTQTEMKARAAYFGCVDYLDELLGDFLAMLEAAGYLEDTIVVYTSDHGDMIGEHGSWGKGNWRADSIRVPLLVELPGHRRGEIDSHEFATPVSLIDLYPTFCGLAGLTPPTELDGTDLSDSLVSGTEPERGPVFVDYLTGDGDFRVICDERYKYVRPRHADDKLIDVDSDPHERTDLSTDPETEEIADRLRALADERMDFDRADEVRAEARTFRAAHDVPVSRGTAGNAYLLGNDRVVDGDLVRTKPDVLVGDAQRLFVDYPHDTLGARGPTAAPAPDRDQDRVSERGRFQ